jgi:hypothetical protein
MCGLSHGCGLPTALNRGTPERPSSGQPWRLQPPYHACASRFRFFYRNLLHTSHHPIHALLIIFTILILSIHPPCDKILTAALCSQTACTEKRERKHPLHELHSNVWAAPVADRSHCNMSGKCQTATALQNGIFNS